MHPSSATQQYKRRILESGVPIQLVILGKDAFPQGAIGIAFCKEKWDGQASHTCSGRYVLEALGVDWRAEQAKGGDPVVLFEALRDAGVVFFNACYLKPDKTRFTKKTHDVAIKAAYAFNREILEAADEVILCGQAELMRWAYRFSDEKKYFKRVHPSRQNGISPHASVRDAWDKTWGAPCSLADYWPNKPAGLALIEGAKSA